MADARWSEEQLLHEMDNVFPRLMMALADAPTVLWWLSWNRDRLRQYGGSMTTLDEAREYVRYGRGKGVDCPCCSQNAKVYRRPITKEMVGCLFRLIRIFMEERTWIEGRRLKKQGGDYAKLAHWQLIEFDTKKPRRRRQGGGIRPTRTGVLFARAMVSLPSHVYLYNTDVLGFDEAEKITVRDVRGFDYDEVCATIVGAENLPWE